jgi:hypothetical protein
MSTKLRWSRHRRAPSQWLNGGPHEAWSACGTQVTNAGSILPPWLTTSTVVPSGAAASSWVHSSQWASATAANPGDCARSSASAVGLRQCHCSWCSTWPVGSRRVGRRCRRRHTPSRARSRLHAVRRWSRRKRRIQVSGPPGGQDQLPLVTGANPARGSSSLPSVVVLRANAWSNPWSPSGY